MPGPADASAARRGAVVEHLRRSVTSLAEETYPIAEGLVVRTPSLPLVWTLNQLRISAPVSPAVAMALAEEHQGDQPYRHIVFEDAAHLDPPGDDPVPGGWQVDHEVLMVLDAEPDRIVDTGAVVALSEAQMVALMRRWIVEELPDISGDGLDQVVEYNRREGRLWQERRFGCLDDGGAPVAVTKLRTQGPVAWVEDVYTVPEARGRGCARILVTHATTTARSEGADLTFIVADDNDWPKHLYARIGFRSVGTSRTWHRGPDEAN